MKIIFLIPISVGLLVASATNAYSNGFAIRQAAQPGAVQSSANHGPLIIPVDVGPNTTRYLPSADPAHAQDPAFLKKLNEAVNAVVWELYDQKVIPNTTMRSVSPSFDAQGNVRALTISGDKFLVNGPVIFNGENRTFKASVTVLR